MTALSRILGGALTSTPFRLAATMVALYAVAAGLLVALLTWHANRELATETLAEIRLESDDLVRSAQGSDAAALVEAVRRRSEVAGDRLYLLLGADGQRLAGNLAALPAELAGRSGGAVFRITPDHGGHARLAVAERLDVAGARLVVGRDVEPRSRFVESVLATSLAGFGVLALAGLAAGLVAGRGLMARLEAINAATRTIIAGKLSERIPLAGTGDEIDGLARNLNEMLERIEGLMGALREVSDNIAHDLKTPLNRLRNRAEATLRSPEGEAAYREGLARVIDEADELIKTFNALLLIARLEAGAIDETVSPVALGEVVRDVVELYEPVADEQGLTLVAETGEAPHIEANRQLVGQAVANLVDNAIKYGGDGADQGAGRECRRRIEITVGENATEGLVSIADHGPGIGAADRERVLRRFVRLDESRTRPGTGLGLSLVAAVARLHGGVLKLEDNAPGLRAILVLPKRRPGHAAS